MVRIIGRKKPLLELDLTAIDDLVLSVAARRDNLRQDILFWKGHAERMKANGDADAITKYERFVAQDNAAIARLEILHDRLVDLALRREGVKP